MHHTELETLLLEQRNIPFHFLVPRNPNAAFGHEWCLKFLSQHLFKRMNGKQSCCPASDRFTIKKELFHKCTDIIKICFMVIADDYTRGMFVPSQLNITSFCSNFFSLTGLVGKFSIFRKKHRSSSCTPTVEILLGNIPPRRRWVDLQKNNVITFWLFCLH